jgi:hypothetical protein
MTISLKLRDGGADLDAIRGTSDRLPANRGASVSPRRRNNPSIRG